jgi:GTP-binding protein
LIGVEKFRQVPRSTVPEVAFLGRSNVGKSSLLNALFAQKLAHTSGRPGRTTSMNFYGVGGIGHGGASLKRGPNNHMNIEGEGGLVVVDTPGYGFASREGWGTEVLKYLTDREQLRRVFLLVDAGHGLKQQDKQILKILHSSGVPYQVLLSKADKVYIPDIGKYFSTRLAHNAKRVKPRGTLEELHAMMNSIREYIGEENCYEMLACSGEVKLNGRLLGIDNVRYSVMKSTLGVKEEERPPSIFEQKGGIRKMHVSLIKRNPDTVFA